MAEYTDIEYADSAVNPIAGCDGCELLPTAAQVRTALARVIANGVPGMEGQARAVADEICGGVSARQIYTDRELIFQAPLVVREHLHGADWTDWAKQLCVREYPRARGTLSLKPLEWEVPA